MVVLLVDSNCKVLTGKVSVFCLGGRLWEADAYERWSHMEVRPTVSIFYFNKYCFLYIFLYIFPLTYIFIEGSKLVNCEMLLRLPL